MYAVAIDNKYTGVAYDAITPAVTEWCEQYGAVLIPIDKPLANQGTDDEPDYGSPSQTQLNAVRITEIDRLLAAIDVQTVRPMRAKLAGTNTASDDERLAALDAQAAELRTERMAISQNN